MGSRRSRRAHGRVLNSRPTKKATLTISKTQKHANRVQQKASVLAAARTARQATRRDAPFLIALLPLTDISDDRLSKVATELRAAPQEKSLHPFNTAIVRRGVNNRRDLLLNALDIAKVADILLLVFDGRDDIDEHAINLIDAVRAQGLPTIHALAIGDGRQDAELRKLRSRQLAAESLGEDHALRPIAFDIDNDDDAAVTNQSALRRLLSKTPSQVAWRARYGYMYVESVMADTTTPDEPTAPLKLCGWVRGRGFSANELVHITGLGSFAASKIVDLASGETLSTRVESEAEPVESEAEVDDLMGEQTWPPEVDGGDMQRFDEKEADEDTEIKDEGEQLASEYDALAEDDNDTPNNNNNNDENGIEMEDVEASEGVMTAGDDMTIDEGEVERTRNAAKSHMEFPDEVDTPMDQPARVRFARYRGLKSLRTGEWDPKEQLPREYASLFQFRNLAATRKRVLAQAKKEGLAAATTTMNSGGNFAPAGKRVYIELNNVPQSIRECISARLRSTNGSPIIASGMLRHENRRSVVHFAVRRLESVEDSVVIKAKSHMEMHCGFVRFDGRPMFSENNANSDKHKMERYLKPGVLTVASFYGPAIFAPAPALLCHANGEVVATGSALGADADRIILKRIILTGYPFKTQKKRTVTRFMFFNPDDIRWFKPVELWTKLGRSGHIVEPIGTHGLMKCIFDNVVMHHDTVCMTLYKRVYPKLSETVSSKC